MRLISTKSAIALAALAASGATFAQATPALPFTWYGTIEVAAEALLSFDDDQIALAEAAGLPVLRLHRKQR